MNGDHTERLSQESECRNEDAVDGNVLVDDEGHLFFIDTIIYESGTGGVETYNSLSPRASSKSRSEN